MGPSAELTQPDSLHDIVFADLRACEVILIETKNSSYRFCVSDSLQRQGYLSGGSLGERPIRAILMGMVAKRGDSYITETGFLKTGGRALFYLETETGMKHLVTSPITRLVHNKNTPEQKYIF